MERPDTSGVGSSIVDPLAEDLAAPAATPAAAPTAKSGNVPAGVSFDSPREAQDFFKDPEAMLSAAQIFLKNGLPQGVAWIERGHQLAKENGIEALQQLVAGNGEQALKAWNSSGRFRDAQSVKSNGDGTWTVTRKGGQQVTVNPEAELRATMNPHDYFTYQLEQRKAATAEEHNKILRENLQSEDAYRKGMLKNASDKTEMLGHIQDLKNQFAAERAQWSNELRQQALKTAPGMIYQEAAARLQKEGVDPAAAATAAADHLLRSTASIGEMKDGKFALGGRTPDGNWSPIAVFDTREEAQKAYLDFFKGGPAPAQQPSKADAAARAIGPPEPPPPPPPLKKPRRLPPVDLTPEYQNLRAYTEARRGDIKNWGR